MYSHSYRDLINSLPVPQESVLFHQFSFCSALFEPLQSIQAGTFHHPVWEGRPCRHVLQQNDQHTWYYSPGPSFHAEPRLFATAKSWWSRYYRPIERLGWWPTLCRILSTWVGCEWLYQHRSRRNHGIIVRRNNWPLRRDIPYFCLEWASSFAHCRSSVEIPFSRVHPWGDYDQILGETEGGQKMVPWSKGLGRRWFTKSRGKVSVY